MSGTELEPTTDQIVTKVDPAEVPSAAWGWSGESHRTFRVAAVVVGLIMLAMLIGNHSGNVENLYLIGIAVVLFGIVIRDIVLQRKPR